MEEKKKRSRQTGEEISSAHVVTGYSAVSSNQETRNSSDITPEG